MKIIKSPDSELEQAAILLSLTREQFTHTLFGPALLTGHPVTEIEVEEAYTAAKARVIELATQAGYIAPSDAVAEAEQSKFIKADLVPGREFEIPNPSKGFSPLGEKRKIHHVDSDKVFYHRDGDTALYHNSIDDFLNIIN